MTRQTDQMPTKERIIETAGEIFGDQGFKAATIRSIAEAAQVNVAAINYHFGDKERLYHTVLEDIFDRGFETFPSVTPLSPGQDPEKQLQRFIRDMFSRLSSQEGLGVGTTGKGRLIAREFLDPTQAFEEIVETYIKPHRDVLLSILAGICGTEADDPRLKPCAVSILGQCVYFSFAAPLIKKLMPECVLTPENLEELAHGVYLFSLGGIKQLAGRADE
ncbi:CerR family C-terminal domain-containing protein [Desulfospira joergensenii]|uniref:CerR family C-terminal domain-containing protein n=1 Tax=Desulfospira joergensenii TaxID=53329 RepID=UPI0003B78F9E|nr:CerR family C-terminal domain-containing protein [Desulfospira joergensenii]